MMLKPQGSHLESPVAVADALAAPCIPSGDLPAVAAALIFAPRERRLGADDNHNG